MRVRRYAVWLWVIAGLGLAQTAVVSALLMVPEFRRLLEEIIDRLMPGQGPAFETALLATRLLFLAGLAVFLLAAGAGWAVHKGRERWLAAVGGAALLSPVGTVYLWPFSAVLGWLLLKELTLPDGRAAFGEPLPEAAREGRTSLERVAVALGASGASGIAWSAFCLFAILNTPNSDAEVRGITYFFAGANGLVAALWLLSAALCWTRSARGAVIAVLVLSLVPCLTACSWLVAAPIAIWALVVLRRADVRALFVPA